MYNKLFIIICILYIIMINYLILFIIILLFYILINKLLETDKSQLIYNYNNFLDKLTYNKEFVNKLEYFPESQILEKNYLPLRD